MHWQSTSPTTEYFGAQTATAICTQDSTGACACAAWQFHTAAEFAFNRAYRSIPLDVLSTTFGGPLSRSVHSMCPRSRLRRLPLLLLLLLLPPHHRLLQAEETSRAASAAENELAPSAITPPSRADSTRKRVHATRSPGIPATSSTATRLARRTCRRRLPSFRLSARAQDILASSRYMRCIRCAVRAA